ncbi:MAG TPA: polysaccharide deacetylase family protein [Gemmataceae bacterium]|nr:polysaccharide deacetylase family protein [Gemmataceae bacterium]
MLIDGDIKGTDLPAKTLCLTYDDGPGPHTRELGRYLADEGISAAFFVVGRHAEGREDVLRDLRDGGHLIGNHTYSHAGLITLWKTGGDVVEEVARADAVIRPFVREGPVLLRPPYGSWREKTRPGGPEDAPTSPVADLLRRSGPFEDYVGPIKWEIVAEDWECWRCGVSPEECARRHLEAVERVGRGIVLMHDSSDEPEMVPRNRTMQMTKLLVPALRARGYRFVGLGAMPQVVRWLQ